ncbi:hypothetical protein ACF07V_19120 [Streptomyces sp. NPDC015661]|uniref:hypothetical protein n=1 Tax=Streptomyces sp. NPDC015661 TaxID=3364961 RepID=UPI003700A598
MGKLCPSDATDEATVAVQDLARADDLVACRLHGDGAAGPVGIGAGHRLDGVDHDGPQDLVERPQRPHFLFNTMRVPRAQYPSLQQGVA